MSESDTILFPTLDDLVTDSLIHTKSMFLNNYPQKTPDFSQASKLKLKSKMISDYGGITLGDKEMTSFSSLIQRKFQLKQLKQEQSEENQSKTAVGGILDTISSEAAEKLSKIPQKFLIKNDDEIRQTQSVQMYEGSRIPGILATRQKKVVKPDWHAPWKLMRVISGHQGWVRCVTVDPSNQWFATGSNDRTIKIWDLATGQLKLTLTGHINTVRDLAISPKHMYLFSCGEDKTVRCWDLEYNKVVRNYHGHLSGVYCLTLHPSLDVIVSGGRDSTCRVWDIRTRSQIHVLGGHSHVVSSVISQEFEPQVVSGSHDDTIRLWDLSMGKTIHTLTNHKKAVRGMIFHPSEYTFISAAHDNVKVWKCPEGEFLRNISGHKEILNTVSINRDNVLVAGGDKGSLHFWDYKTGHQFQTIKSTVQPGSISAEAGIFQCTFDKSSLRLITAECDKTIKIWKEDETATPETHPVGNIKLNMDTYGNH